MQKGMMILGLTGFLVLQACTPMPASTFPSAATGQLGVLGPAPTPPSPVFVPRTDPPPQLLPTKPVPTIGSAAAVVMDGVTGRILAAKNADERRAVASTQKLLTALVVLDSGPLSTPMTVQHSDTQVEPSKVDIRAGETYTRAALLKALMVKSGNDVARALAREVGGSQEGFASLMNAKAASIGMRNSFFKNPHGLTEEGQLSTARDVAILAREAYQSPVIREFAKVKSYTFTHPGGATKTLTNTNQLLGDLPYCTGMKTGTTNASGRCLVSSGELDGRFVIVVVLGANGTTMLYKDSKALLQWGLER